MLSSSSMRAGATTPADTDRCRSLASQSANGLPLNNGGSASALSVSRPAQRSLRVPARMVAEPPYAALCHQSASVYIVASVNRPGCYQPERQLLRGVRTRQKKAPFHGARRSSRWKDRFGRFSVRAGGNRAGRWGGSPYRLGVGEVHDHFLLAAARRDEPLYRAGGTQHPRNLLSTFYSPRS